MKIRELLKSVEEELINEQAELVKQLLKEKTKEIKDCKKTMKILEEEYEKLLDTNIDDIEEFEW